MDLLQSFKKTVQRHRLFDKSHKLLLAVSGGSDSVALSHVCQELGYNFGIAHINYQLRGMDSNEDDKSVESLAANLNVPFHSRTVDCAQSALEHKRSIQEEARNIRYAFFDTVIALHEYDYVLTAHHAKDNVETMLYTLAKGASLKALRGIPIRRDKIVRPLLHSTKSSIDIYLRRNEISYRHDTSNDSTKYKRNYIRHEILPHFEQINPNIESTLTNTSILGLGYQDLLGDLLSEQKSQFQESKKLDLKPMLQATSKYAWLYEMIHPVGFNFNDSLEIWTAIDHDHSTGKVFQSADYQITINRGHLILNKNEEDDLYQAVQITSIETVQQETAERVHIKLSNNLPNESGAYFDAHKIHFPLTLRRWQPGDRFKPSGMKGKSKKIKDYLTDQKISGPAKSKVEVLVSEEEIIWVVGYRMAHGYKANSESRSILSIEVK